MRRPLILLAALLVVFTNLAALGLAALNRHIAESDIVLTERELPFVDDGSVTSLQINWMQPAPDALTGDMVSRAGFRTDRRPSDPGADEYYSRQLQRDVFVALEYDGPAWSRYRELLQRQSPAGGSATPQPGPDASQLQEIIDGHTRLFVVDVDMDAHRLRSRHPDRRRYVISTARVNVMLWGTGNNRVPALSVRQLEPSSINVPRPFSTMLRAIAGPSRSPHGSGPDARPRYEVHLHYGRFHEPWMSDVRASKF